MFTGIIEATAKVFKQGGNTLTLERPQSFDDVKVGSSIAVSGVCLTVTGMDERSLTFDVMPETLHKTTIGDLAPLRSSGASDFALRASPDKSEGRAIGDFVNLERALPAHGRFEGHVVQGHVEGVGEITGLERVGEDVRLTVRVPPDLKRAIVPKGSICLDGVSLTVADVGPETCTVALIPLTLRETTLGGKRMGDHVNIETDILVRTLLASHRSIGISE